ncbi:vacuolar protein sorting-associated protein 26C isoform X1 [Rosa chinensis]|uniref:vacuolar protein sorting-associated protein 26C isoform X1 n=1 Tax=Rosa chinensis TaxID=74649 RepID=UPI000D08FDAF|nr:vacuolar protein sorting-associated protein 26C isoform X1 [Rosa chinensis]
MSIELKLSRINRVYRPSELVEGKIIVKSVSSISHYGIRIAVDGSVNLQVRGGTAGVIETLVGAAKPISILRNKIVELRPAGKIASGITEIPFSMHIRQPREDNLEKFYETFHGGNINIQVHLSALESTHVQ